MNLVIAARIWFGTLEELKKNIPASCARLIQSLSYTDTENFPPFGEFEEWVKALIKHEDAILYEAGPSGIRTAFGSKEAMNIALQKLKEAWADQIEVNFYEDRGPTYCISFKVVAP